LEAPPAHGEASAHGEANPLLAAKQRIHSKLGNTEVMAASSGAELCALYNKCVDSVNDGSEGSLWPTVRRVLLRGPWQVLRHGVRLVDAPGLADDNSARDAVVKRILQEANAVWLVSNIRRAVNDKTVKEQLLPSFKQALVDRGVLGSLCFVATHSDVLLKSEITENLNLPEGTSILECARARNDFFRNKMARDFQRGLCEPAEDGPADRQAQHSWNPQVLQGTDVWDASWKPWLDVALHSAAQTPGAETGLTPDQCKIAREHFDKRVHQHAACLQQAKAPRPPGARFEFVSFAVSAVDYQKLAGLRRFDGASVYCKLEDTQVPALRQFVAATASLQRLSSFRCVLVC
jgi:hypothetical protein